MSLHGVNSEGLTLSSNQHSAGCFQGGCEDARTPPQKRGRKGAMRKGEKVTAEEEGNGGRKEREMNQKERKQ